jgi:hypothetical protein
MAVGTAKTVGTVIPLHGSTLCRRPGRRPNSMPTAKPSAQLFLFFFYKLAQNPKYTYEWCRNDTRADICITGDLLFMQGVVPNFRFYVSVVASQNNLISIL